MMGLGFSYGRPTRSYLDLAALLNPARLQDKPFTQADATNWQDLYALATFHLVSPLLFLRHRELGLLDRVPADITATLDYIYHMNLARNNRQRMILKDTIRILNDANIEPILLKGAVSLLPQQDAFASARMMADIDLIMRNASPERAAQVLIAAGYFYARGQGPRDVISPHHLAPLFHPSGEGYVELHREAFMTNVPANLLPYADLCSEAVRLEWNDLICYAPSLQHRLIHNIVHQRIQNVTRLLPELCSIRQCVEFATIRRDIENDEFDWSKIIQRFDCFNLGYLVRGQLLLAETLFQSRIPVGVTITAEDHARHAAMWWWAAHPHMFKFVRNFERLIALPKRLLSPNWYRRRIGMLLRNS